MVLKRNLDDALSQLEQEKILAFDTETFGLFHWQTDNIPGYTPGVFALQFSGHEKDFYFDFLHNEGRLDAGYFKAIQDVLFSDKTRIWFAHNAKFDMHQLANYGVDIKGIVHCTQAIARVANNVEGPNLRLETLAQTYLGEGKIDLDEYFKAPGTTSEVVRPDGSVEKLKHFDKLPFDVLYKYGIRDTRLTYQLGILQCETIKKQTEELKRAGINSIFKKYPSDLLETERALTKTLFQMERRGVLLDIPYIKEALEFDKNEANKAKDALDKIAQKALAFDVCIDWNSPRQLKPLFDALGIAYTYTEKGQASFDKHVLEASDSELAALILKYRFHSKRASTYWENFLWLVDVNGILHTDFQQGGPETGRMSCRQPNLQNLPKRRDKDQTEYRVRRAFKPRPGKVFFDVDWDQMEYRMMLCYSGEKPLIEKIKIEGLDVHEAVNQEMQIGDREAAKTVNFQTLYGGGVPKLALALFPVRLSETNLKDIYNLLMWRGWTSDDIRKGIGEKFTIGKGRWQKDVNLNFSLEDFEHDLIYLRQAHQLREKYFSALPKTATWIENVKDVAKERGFLVNWAGRKMHYDRETHYKAPNGLIQGGCGDVSKESLVQISELLKGTGTHVLAQVHDEFLIEMDLVDFELAPKILNIMQTTFPSELLNLTAGASWSRISWGDLQDSLQD